MHYYKRLGYIEICVLRPVLYSLMLNRNIDTRYKMSLLSSFKETTGVFGAPLPFVMSMEDYGITDMLISVRRIIQDFIQFILIILNTVSPRIRTADDRQRCEQAMLSFCMRATCM